MFSKIIDRALEIYRISRPVLMVLLLAAMIVFINSYPNVPGIANSTTDYRQQVKNKLNEEEIDENSTKIAPPRAPSLPNTITPFISPEDVNEMANPTPKPTSQTQQPSASNQTNETPQDISPGPNEPPLEIKLLTGFLNVAPLILIAGLGGFGIYLLFKYKKHLTLRSLFGSAISIVTVCTIIFIIAITFDFAVFLYDVDLNITQAIWYVFPIGLLVSIWLSYCIFSKRTTEFRRNMGLAISGALMGSFLAAFLPFWIIFILLIAITLFDIYSVKFGPIKKILELDENRVKKKVGKRVIYRKLSNNLKAKNNSKISCSKRIELTKTEIHTDMQEPLKIAEPIKSTFINKVKTAKNDEGFDLMLMFDNPDWSLGLGDFVIYSMFTSAVLTYIMLYLPYYIFYSPLLGLILPWVIFFFCTLGLLVGFFITIKLLETRDYLPGLPISISIGFIVFVICIIILQLINYFMFNEFAIII